MDYRRELKKRKPLVQKIIQKYQDIGNPIPDIIVENAGKIAFLPTHLASGSQIDYQFLGLARKVGLVPMWIPFSEDTFQSCNQRKKMYLHIYDNFGNIEKLTNPNKWEGKRISEIILDNGESIVDFHLEKWNQIPYQKYICDISKWWQFFGKAEDYYYHTRSLNIAFGVEFWPSNLGLYSNGEKEYFVENIINPANLKVEKEYGFAPLCETFILKPTLY